MFIKGTSPGNESLPFIISLIVHNSQSGQVCSSSALSQHPSSSFFCITFRRNQNFPSRQAFRFCAVCMFSSTQLIGIKKFKLKDRMTRVSRTMKQTMAAFSKSVSWSSQGRNSTLQPIWEFGGGGLKRIVCQFVD